MRPISRFRIASIYRRSRFEKVPKCVPVKALSAQPFPLHMRVLLPSFPSPLTECVIGRLVDGLLELLALATICRRAFLSACRSQPVHMSRSVAEPDACCTPRYSRFEGACDLLLAKMRAVLNEGKERKGLQRSSSSCCTCAGYCHVVDLFIR